MNAEVLSWQGQSAGTSADVTEGSWDTYQDPISKEILNTWVPGTPSSPGIPAVPTPKTIDCLARGIVSGGLRAAGTSESFGKDYENIDYVRLWVPASVKLNKRDRVTNIRDKKGGTVLWADEEYGSGTRPTVFNVNGVTPLLDAFNRHIESLVLLERADGYSETYG